MSETANPRDNRLNQTEIIDASQKRSVHCRYFFIFLLVRLVRFIMQHKSERTTWLLPKQPQLRSHFKTLLLNGTTLKFKEAG